MTTKTDTGTFKENIQHKRHRYIKGEHSLLHSTTLALPANPRQHHIEPSDVTVMFSNPINLASKGHTSDTPIS